MVEAYRARGCRVDFVHSKEESASNSRVMTKLEAHELDVIVQVRKLGEGFDHPYLSVAAVFSIFANLSPFVQFVGRIMRVIEQDSPCHPLNQGTVVFHAGANIARRWEDFKEYSEADQQYFDQLLPVEGLNFSDASEISIEPTPREPNTLEVRGQTDVIVEEMPLLNDDVAMQLITQLRDLGYSADAVHQAMKLQPVPTTKQHERQAARQSLDTRIKTETAKLLQSRQINPNGYDLDRKHLKRTNFVIVKAAIDKHVNNVAGRRPGERHEFSRPELDLVNQNFPELVDAALKEIFGG